MFFLRNKSNKNFRLSNNFCGLLRYELIAVTHQSKLFSHQEDFGKICDLFFSNIAFWWYFYLISLLLSFYKLIMCKKIIFFSSYFSQLQWFVTHGRVVVLCSPSLEYQFDVSPLIRREIQTFFIT